MKIFDVFYTIETDFSYMQSREMVLAKDLKEARAFFKYYKSWAKVYRIRRVNRRLHARIV